jgi:hypothetical protein
MKKCATALCVVCLLIPVLAHADQPDIASLPGMLTQETIPVDELRSLMTHLLNPEGFPADEITPEANLQSYVCFYIALSAIIDFIDCLVYYTSYDCRSAIINALFFSYFC